MKTTIATPDFSINGFSATHIFFDNTEYATIWAKCRVNNQLQDVHLVVNFSVLNDMMRFSGTQGEKILLSMVEEMMSKKEPPFVVVLKDIIGQEAIFTSVKLTVCQAANLAELPADDVATCYFIQEAWPINIIQQAKNLITHKRDFAGGQIVSQEVINTSLQQLSSMYNYYLGLQQLELSETACRYRAQLADDRLFTMAKNAYQTMMEE